VELLSCMKFFTVFGCSILSCCGLNPSAGLGLAEGPLKLFGWLFSSSRPNTF